MGLLALMLMLATPSFAQKKSSLDVKAKKTTAFEQANMRAEFYKQHPAMAKAPKMLKKDNSGLAKTVVGRLRAQQKSATHIYRRHHRHGQKRPDRCPRAP